MFNIRKSVLLIIALLSACGLFLAAFFHIFILCFVFFSIICLSMCIDVIIIKKREKELTKKRVILNSIIDKANLDNNVFKELLYYKNSSINDETKWAMRVLNFKHEQVYSRDDIKRAYRVKVRTIHPDLHQGTTSTNIGAEVKKFNKAKKILLAGVKNEVL